MTDFCPECLKKDLALKDAEKELKAQKEEHARELAAANAKPAPVPTLADVKKHAAAGCVNCQKDLQADRAEIVADTLKALNTPERILEVAHQHPEMKDLEFFHRPAEEK